MGSSYIPDEIRDAPAVKSGEVLSYVDEPVDRYVAGLKLITKADELRAYLAKWPFLAADAIEQARDLTDDDIQYMIRYRADEEKGYEVAMRFGAILIPTRCVRLSSVAMELKVPTGLVYVRSWNTGEHDELMRLP